MNAVTAPGMSGNTNRTSAVTASVLASLVEVGVGRASTSPASEAPR